MITSVGQRHASILTHLRHWNNVPTSYSLEALKQRANILLTWDIETTCQHLTHLRHWNSVSTSYSLEALKQRANILLTWGIETTCQHLTHLSHWNNVPTSYSLEALKQCANILLTWGIETTCQHLPVILCSPCFHNTTSEPFPTPGWLSWVRLCWSTFAYPSKGTEWKITIKENSNGYRKQILNDINYVNYGIICKWLYVKQN